MTESQTPVWTSLAKTAGKKKPDPFTKHVVNEIKNNKNFLCLVTGGPGSGKSYTAMSLGLKINAAQGLNQPPYIFFDLKLVLKCLADGFFKPGSVIIIDEAGLMANSRTFMKQENVILSKVCQSFRYLNLVTFFCVPQFSFVDVAIQRLVHCHIKTLKILRAQNKALVKPTFVQFKDYKKKDLKRTYLPITTLKGHSKVGILAVPKPPKQLTDMYEDLKDKYLKSEYKTFLEKFTQDQNLDWMPIHKKALELDILQNT